MANGSCLASSQFDGDCAECAAPPIEGGQSTYDGALAVTLLDRSVVEQALPNGFALAPRADPGDGVTTHPVVHMIGFQGSPMLLQEGEAIPAPDPGYTELIVLIPYVVKVDRRMWHSFVVRMYLNDPAAIFIGNTYYSYRKAFAAFDGDKAGQTETLVRSYLEGDVFRSSVTRTGAWISCCGGAPAVPCFADVRKLLTMPLLGAFVDPLSQDPFQVICSYWEWDFRCAEVATATSAHEYQIEIAPGTNGWVGSASAPPDGAMLVRGLRWRIPLPPEQCQF